MQFSAHMLFHGFHRFKSKQLVSTQGAPLAIAQERCRAQNVWVISVLTRLVVQFDDPDTNRYFIARLMTIVKAVGKHELSMCKHGHFVSVNLV